MLHNEMFPSLCMNRRLLLHELKHCPLKRHGDNPVTPQDDPSQFKKYLNFYLPWARFTK